MNQQNKIECASADGKVFLDVGNIYSIESSGNHSYIVTANTDKIFVTNSLKDLTDRLGAKRFCRIHRQYLINMAKIHKYQQSEGGTIEMENGIKYPISKSGKVIFVEMLKDVY